MKNIVKIYLLLIMIASFAMVSCAKEEQDQYTGGLGGYVPIGNMTIHPLGDEFKVHFTSNSSWKIFGIPKWMEVSKTEGAAGTFDLTFNVEAFYKGTDDYRRTEIIFQNLDTKETIIQKFKIEQNAAYINVVGAAEGDSNVSFGWQKNDNVKKISIDSSVEYTITIDNNADFAIETEGAQELIDDNGEVIGYFVNLECAKNKPQFTITPKNYNFSSEDNTANISVTPVRSKPDGKDYNELSDVDEDLPESLSVSQDFLIYKVFEGSINDINDVEEKLKENDEEVVIDGISELGHTYLNSNQSEDDNDLAVRKIVIVAESGVEYDVSAAANYGCNFVEGDAIPDAVAGRNVTLTEYDVQVLKPNPKGDNVNVIEIPIPITGYEDEEDIPILSVNLEQDPYVFNIVDADNNNESGLPFDNEGSSEMKYYTLKTSGPWELSDYAQEWLVSDIEFNEDGKLSGEGDFTFGLKTDGRNMSFAHDNFVELLFSSGNFGGDLSTPFNSKFTVSQEKFEFDIKCGEETNLKLTSSDTEKHGMSITSSGPWELPVSDNSDNSKWLTISDLDSNDNGVFAGEATTDTAKSFKIQATRNTGEIPRHITLKLISKLHRDAGYDENEYTKKFIVKQDELHCAILEEEGGEPWSGCHMLAYDPEGLKQEFYLDCSAPWKVKGSLPDWIELWAQSDDGDEYQITSGDGTKYLTITATIEANDGDFRGDREPVVLQADIDADGNYEGSKDRELSFTVTQDGFVFKKLSDDASPYEFDAINSTPKKFSFEVTKGAFDDISKKDWLGLTQESKNDSGNKKTEIYTYTVKPGYNVEGDRKYRSHTVTISNKVNDKTIDIPIKQKEFDFALDKTSLDDFNELLKSVSSDKQTIEIEGDDYEHVEVEVKYDEEEYDEVSGWLTVVQNEYLAKKWSFYPNSNNLAKGARTGEIQFIVKRDLVNNQTIVLKSIPVKQKGYVWEVSADETAKVDPANEDTKKIKIKSSGKWEIKKDDNVKGNDYIKEIYPDDGGKNNDMRDEEQTSTITFKKYFGETENTIKVKVICEDNEKYNKDLTFIQSGYKFNVTCGGDKIGSTYSIDVDADGDELVFDVDCSDSKDWNYEADPEDMIEVNKTDKKLTVKVLSNMGDKKKKTEARECSIEIFLKNGTEQVRTKTITIKQEGYDPKKK